MNNNQIYKDIFINSLSIDTSKFSEKLKKRSKLKNVFFYNKQLKFNNLDNLKNYDIIFLFGMMTIAIGFCKADIIIEQSQNYWDSIGGCLYFRKHSGRNQSLFLYL